LSQVRKAYDHGEEADSNPSDETTDVKHFDHYSGSLDDSADDKDAACHHDSSTPTKRICKTRQECADKAASGEQGNDGSGASICIFL
jgi:hypothetical protein